MSGKSDKRQNAPQDQSNTIKDPDDWTTGEEPMTGAQESYLHTLAYSGHRGGGRSRGGSHQGGGIEENRRAPPQDRPGRELSLV